ncbi:S1 RNA-binding domain-containing protein [Rufibacter sediminis]|uniref:GntR family transcriptional regulator n=1 Tax=Rufibacter sediminis TaxID=2762756 RepID=A0ABR6VP00_9BACT|nr:S1-like domain-containing RNA-binding protein [Rufibacter sediminis]MBC3538925.1 GntR family transcriptional regulator [Rufibacter sediminis]
MLHLGDYNYLEILRDVEHGLYLGSDDGDVLLPRKYVPAEARIGDMISVFVYRDSEDRLIATTLEPKAKVDQFACLQVRDVNNFGAFMEWGLEKDLFVPFKNQHDALYVGQWALVYVYLDENSDRLVGSTKLGPFLNYDTITLEEGDEVQLLIGPEKALGFQVIVNNKYLGMLYRNEVFRSLEPGEYTQGYLKKVREDNKLDVSLQKQGYDEVLEASETILARLRAEQGHLPLTDKSTPELIYQTLGMSKKTFKKAIGALYKRGEVQLLPEGISLLDKS